MLVTLPVTLSAFQVRADYGVGRRDSGLVLRKVIEADIRPATVEVSPRHEVVALSSLRKEIYCFDSWDHPSGTYKSSLSLAEMGFPNQEGIQQGSPNGVVFTHGGKYAWILQSHIQGPGFGKPAGNDCLTNPNIYDKSYLFRFNLKTRQIEQALQVGSYPKSILASADGTRILVSNWCSGDIYIIDAIAGKLIHKVAVGGYPRGMAINHSGSTAYITRVGAPGLIEIDLASGKSALIPVSTRNAKVSEVPTAHDFRYLAMDPYDRYIYGSNTAEGSVWRFDIQAKKFTGQAVIGHAPRKLVISVDGHFLYVLNYLSNTLVKVNTRTMEVVQEISTPSAPSDLAFDPDRNRLWVACPSGSLLVYEDLTYTPFPGKHLTRNLGTGKIYHPAPTGIPEMEETVLSSAPAQRQEGPALKTRMLSPIPAEKIPPFISPETRKKFGISSGADPEAPLSSPESSPPPTHTADTTYHLIVGSFSTRNQAEAFIRQLDAPDLDPRVVSGAPDRHRVSAAQFSRPALADAFKKRLKDHWGLDAWILKAADSP